MFGSLALISVLPALIHADFWLAASYTPKRGRVNQSTLLAPLDPCICKDLLSLFFMADARSPYPEWGISVQASESASDFWVDAAKFCSVLS
jgi:hypothetical protein